MVYGSGSRCCLSPDVTPTQEEFTRDSCSVVTPTEEESALDQRIGVISDQSNVVTPTQEESRLA